jgi:hypothetical protein
MKNEKKEKFTVIESDGEGGGLIHHIEVKNFEDAVCWADEMCGCAFVVLNQQDFDNMCQKGCGA